VWLWCCIGFGLRDGEEDDSIVVNDICHDLLGRRKKEKGARWLHDLD